MTDREEWLTNLAELEDIERNIRRHVAILKTFPDVNLHTLFLEDADALREYIRREKTP